MIAIKTAATWVWTYTPWYIKWAVAIIIVPNIIINAAIFFLWFLPWHGQSIEAHIIPRTERTDAQISRLIERQTDVNERMNDNILRIERHQTIFMQELLRRQPANNP